MCFALTELKEMLVYTYRESYADSSATFFCTLKRRLIEWITYVFLVEQSLRQI